jgi:hypothetical protein
VWRALQLLVGDQILCVRLETINPAVAHSVAELLLLAPQELFRQVLPLPFLHVKGLAQDVLLNPACVHGQGKYC